jgi:hypothetical protein
MQSLCADNQLILPDSDDDLQRALHTLHSNTKHLGMKILQLKSKRMAFKGQVPIRSKTVRDNTILEKGNRFIVWDVKFHTKRKCTHLLKLS